MIRKILTIVGTTIFFILVREGVIHIFFLAFPIGALSIIAGTTKRLGLLTFGAFSDEAMEWFYSFFGLFPANLSLVYARCVIGGVIAVICAFVSLAIM